MEDDTATLYLNQCTVQATLKTTHSGLRLTKGRMFIDNNVVIETKDRQFSSVTLTSSQHHGASAYSVAWNPKGDCLAVGGENGDNDLIIHGWCYHTFLFRFKNQMGLRSE